MRDTLDPPIVATRPEPGARGVSPRYRIQAIERAVSILNAFSPEDPELGVTELAERLGLHKSTVHRFMVNLDAAGLVERNPRTGRYRLGLRIFELGGLVMQQMNLWDEALPFLEGLVHDTGETGHLAVLDGGEAIYIERVEARRALRVPSAIGRGYPAHATNLGKVLLADLPRERVDGDRGRARPGRLHAPHDHRPRLGSRPSSSASARSATRSTTRSTTRACAASGPRCATTRATWWPRSGSAGRSPASPPTAWTRSPSWS